MADSNLLQTIENIVQGNASKLLLHNNANKATERIPVIKNMMMLNSVFNALRIHAPDIKKKTKWILS